MFERFTEGARRTIFFARFEASHLGSQEVEPEHLLLGLVRQADFFGDARMAIRSEIEAQLPRAEKISTSVDLPISRSLKKALLYAAEESEKANHAHLGVEHLLAGLARESGSITALLRKHGIDPEKILLEVPRKPTPDVLPGIAGDGAAQVFETHRLHRGHEIILIERYRPSEDGRKLICEIGIKGLGKSVQQTIEFDLPEK